MASTVLMKQETKNATTSQVVRARRISSTELEGDFHRLQSYHAATSQTNVRFRETVMLAKLRKVPVTCLAEVDSFIDKVIEREAGKRPNRAIIDSISAIADEPFGRYWDNPKDAEYDKL